MSEAAPKAIALTPVDFDPFAETAAADVLPLTEPQAEVWAAVQMGNEASCAYNQCFSLTLRGALSAESMQNALRQVMDRHDALRVSIDAETQHQLISGFVADCSAGNRSFRSLAGFPDGGDRAISCTSRQRNHSISPPGRWCEPN